MPLFTVKAPFAPAGDQPEAIRLLSKGVDKGVRHQTLLGATGTGKTCTVAHVIAHAEMPTLVIAHNKTLAAQLAQEYALFFPDHAVHYFVSYYDFYQPEAYLPVSDTYIEKEAMINAEIERLRHASTQALLTRRDTIVVASVSCIYGLGSPEEYKKVHLALAVGAPYTRAELTRDIVRIHFTRTNADLAPGLFRARGNTLEVMPVNERTIWRFTLGEASILHIEEIDPLSRIIRATPPAVFLFPAKHFITGEAERARALTDIQKELTERLAVLEREGKVLERERLKRRTAHDLALIKEVGYCNGIENYSRHFDGRKAGEAPHTLLSYFPHHADGSPDFLTVVDESHVALPQLGGMYAGDRSRKETLVAHGFRLPSALDNRPLRFEEFEARVGMCIYTSATPGAYEYEKCCLPQEKESGAPVKKSREEEKEARTCPFVVEQVIRPTGLLDPSVEVRPIVSRPEYAGQIEDFITEALKAVSVNERVLVTTLTKKMAEDLATFLKERGVHAEYLHSDIKTIERIEILTAFRKGVFDVLVGVNLLREGLDLPEVALVGILDADKEGFLRSETALIQTIGRAARNVCGRVLLYADERTPSLERAIAETERRRAKQEAYNKAHGITPRSVQKAIVDITDRLQKERAVAVDVLQAIEGVDKKTKATLVREKKAQMREAVERLDFETAALVRDELLLLEGGETKNKKKNNTHTLSIKR